MGSCLERALAAQRARAVGADTDSLLMRPAIILSRQPVNGPRVRLENITFVPDARVLEGLEVILENYKSPNATRCSRQGRMVISAFKGSGVGIRDILTQNFPGVDVWVDNLRTTGP